MLIPQIKLMQMQMLQRDSLQNLRAYACGNLNARLVKFACGVKCVDFKHAQYEIKS